MFLRKNRKRFDGTFLRKNRKRFDGVAYEYWTLCETARTERGPRQRSLKMAQVLPAHADRARPASAGGCFAGQTDGRGD